jgi:hypothetical protein
VSKRIALVCLLAVGFGVFAGAAFSNKRTDDPIGVAVSPHSLQLGLNQGGKVTVHTSVSYGLVEIGSLTLNGIGVSAAFADSQGNLVAVFSESAVKAIVSPPSAVLTLEGVTKAGEALRGSDTVQVVVHKGTD